MKFILFKIRNLSCLLLIVSSITLLESCEESSVVTSTKGTLAGKVYSVSKFALRNIEIKVGDKSVLTSDDGEFSLSDVEFPCNVILRNPGSNYATKYLNVTEGTSTFIVEGVNSSTLNTKLKITLPSGIFDNSDNGTMIFSDGMNVNLSKEFDTQTPPEDLVVNYGGSVPVTGKLHVIIYSKENSKVVTFDNYAVSENIETVLGQEITYDFSMNQFDLNPGEKTVNINIPVPPSGSYVGFNFLSFSHYKNINSQYPARQSFILQSPEVVIPLNIPGLISFAEIHTSGYVGKERLTEESSQSFQTKNDPQLISPENNAAGISGATEFSYTQSQGTGIYFIDVYNSSTPERYTLVTKDNSFLFSEITEMAEISTSNKTYNYYVRKFGEAADIKDFLNNYYNSEVSYRAGSDLRSFTTGE